MQKRKIRHSIHFFDFGERRKERERETHPRLKGEAAPTRQGGTLKGKAAIPFTPSDERISRNPRSSAVSKEKRIRLCPKSGGRRRPTVADSASKMRFNPKFLFYRLAAWQIRAYFHDSPIRSVHALVPRLHQKRAADENPVSF